MKNQYVFFEASKNAISRYFLKNAACIIKIKKPVICKFKFPFCRFSSFYIHEKMTVGGVFCPIYTLYSFSLIAGYWLLYIFE